jgi:hypothetical protein
MDGHTPKKQADLPRSRLAHPATPRAVLLGSDVPGW